jgi:hypothetical protein
MTTDDFDSIGPGDTIGPGDEELLAGLHRSVAGVTLAVGTADVVALGRRTRNRRRAVAAGIGTSAAAIVAAIGVLAPSASTGTGTGTGSGTGAVQNAAPQKAVTPGTEKAATTPATTPGTEKTTTPTPPTPGAVQTLNIQETGFSLEEKADGTVHLSITQISDPAVVQSVLAKAGVPAVIMVEQVPQGWDLTKGIECKPDPGVVDAGTLGGAIKIDLTHGWDFTIDKAGIPAGDYMTIMQFESHGQNAGSQIGMKVGRQTTCVPEYNAPTDQ